MKKHHVVAILAVLAPPCAVAEVPCSGETVRGNIIDNSGFLIPGATITLDHLRSVKSAANGSFDLTCVPPGSHHLTITATSFTGRDVSFSAPHPDAFNLSLKLATVETNVEVAVDDGLTDATSGGSTHTISGKSLQALADDPDDFLRELQQLGATAGGDPTNTIIAVDGFQDSSRLPPKSSIAYIRVNPDLYSAEYSQPPYAGGRVEVYTKPGQSAFHGAIFTTNGSPFENARDPFSASKAPLGKQRYGFELSGPVGPGVRQGAGSDFALALEYRAINDFAAVNAITLNPTGNRVATLANVATPQRLWLPTARIDWQLTTKDTLIASYSGTVTSLENVGVGGIALSETGYESQQYDHTVRLTNITSFSPHFVHETFASIRFDGERDRPNSTSPQLQVSGAFTGGGATLGPQQLKEIAAEIDDDAILTNAHHTVRLGVQYFTSYEHRRLTTNFNGTYIFGGGAAPVLNNANEMTTITGVEQYRRTLLNLPGGAPTAYTSVTGTPQVKFTQIRAALFIQDEWSLSHGIHISSGMRYALQTSPILLSGATPRIGIQWAPKKKAKWTLHARVGLFTRAFTPTEEAEVLREDGIQRVTNTIYNPKFGDPFPGATPIETLRRLASHFSNSTYASENIGGTYSLHGWNLSGDLTVARNWNSTRSNNINSPINGFPLGVRPGPPDLNVLEVQNSGQGRSSYGFVGVEQRSLKRLQAFLGAVRGVASDDTNGDVFFVPQNSRSNGGEFAQPNGRPVWQVFGNGTIALPVKLQLSSNIYAAGHSRYNITTGFDNNGDGNFNDRPSYATAAVAGVIPTPYGFLVASGGSGVLPRNEGRMPWTVHLDANLQRAFRLTRDAKALRPQILTANVRSSNALNHTNVTQVGGVLGSPLFGVPYAADNGRRIEAGLRYSF